MLRKAGPDSAEPEDRAVLQKCAVEKFPDFEFSQIGRFGIHQIGLAQDHHSRSGTEEFQHLQMFPGLRHDTVIGGYHHNAHVDTGEPADGVF